MRKIPRLSIGLAMIPVFLVLGAAPSALAAYRQDSIPPISRDAAFEQTLKFEASADTAMTPARFLRWMRHWSSPLSAIQNESATEFRPVVNADETHGVRVLATFVYKF